MGNSLSEQNFSQKSLQGTFEEDQLLQSYDVSCKPSFCRDSTIIAFNLKQKIKKKQIKQNKTKKGRKIIQCGFSSQFQIREKEKKKGAFKKKKNVNVIETADKSLKKP
ncbi:hypothetical protein RFI_27012 [Reticulomyxa filosa]|uniref:Uncharacterized protein n=1 Tax=Reticulomyxa filosa TaxID=46433 RepID=X6M9S5_RETFI|nr:hypothetical protein RFI_27012 [Reticulomyxa filosa]|eukprot:ETO10366.1 hypothetical protein RFI_27012 [Reticulomyxa filosa]